MEGEPFDTSTGSAQARLGITKSKYEKRKTLYRRTQTTIY